jgi:hypothetical protein
MKQVRFTTASRKHRVGRDHVRHVMETVAPAAVITSGGNSGWLYIGMDDRGVELEVIVVELEGDVLLVIHAMPRAYRRRG